MRTIVITGASGGIAQSLIDQLPEEDRLILFGRDKERLEKRYADRPNKRCLSYDVMDDDGLEHVIQQMITEEKVDILINNAGYGIFENYDHFTAQDVKNMFQVNTFTSMTFARCFAQEFSRRRQGQIIGVVSMAGLFATQKASVYAATKFALTGFYDALRLEVADQGVVVTTINPGPVETAFFDQADPSGNYLTSVSRFTLSPDKVAKKIIQTFGKATRHVNIPFILAIVYQLHVLFPRTSDFLARKVFNYK